MTHMNPYESAEQFRIILFVFRCGNSNAMAFLMTTIKPEQADSNCINEIWTKKELCSLFMFNFISPI